MTEPLLPFEAVEPRRKVALWKQLTAHLLAHTGQFVSVDEMADLVGHSGVRERRREAEKLGGVLLKRDESGHGEYRNGKYGFVVLGKRPAGSRSEGQAA